MIWPYERAFGASIDEATIRVIAGECG